MWKMGGSKPQTLKRTKTKKGLTLIIWTEVSKACRSYQAMRRIKKMRMKGLIWTTLMMKTHLESLFKKRKRRLVLTWLSRWENMTWVLLTTFILQRLGFGWLGIRRVDSRWSRRRFFKILLLIMQRKLWLLKAIHMPDWSGQAYILVTTPRSWKP